MANLHSLVDGLTLVRNNKDVGSVLLLIQKAVTSLLEGLTPHVQVKHIILFDHGDGIGVSVLAFYSDAQSLNPAGY